MATAPRRARTRGVPNLIAAEQRVVAARLAAELQEEPAPAVVSTVSVLSSDGSTVHRDESGAVHTTLARGLRTPSDETRQIAAALRFGVERIDEILRENGDDVERVRAQANPRTDSDGSDADVSDNDLSDTPRPIGGTETIGTFDPVVPKPRSRAKAKAKPVKPAPESLVVYPDDWTWERLHERGYHLALDLEPVHFIPALRKRILNLYARDLPETGRSVTHRVDYDDDDVNVDDVVFESVPICFVVLQDQEPYIRPINSEEEFVRGLDAFNTNRLGTSRDIFAGSYRSVNAAYYNGKNKKAAKSEKPHLKSLPLQSLPPEQFCSELVTYYDIDRGQFIGPHCYQHSYVKHDATMPVETEQLVDEPPTARLRMKKRLSATPLRPLAINTLAVDFCGSWLLDPAQQNLQISADHLLRYSQLFTSSERKLILIANHCRLEGKTEDAQIQSAYGLGLTQDVDGNWCGRFSTGEGRWAIFTTGSYASVAEYQAKQPTMNTERFVQLWINRHAAQFMQREIELRAELIKAEQALLKVAKQRGENTLLLNAIKSTTYQTLATKVQGLPLLAGVEHFTFDQTGIHFESEEVKYRSRAGDERFLGKYRFHVDLVTQHITIQNLMQQSPGLSGARCVTTQDIDGSICLGSYSQIFVSAFLETDYEVLVLSLLEFVRDAHLRDQLGEPNFLKLFPKSKPRKPVAGPVWNLFYP